MDSNYIIYSIYVMYIDRYIERKRERLECFDLNLTTDNGTCYMMFIIIDNNYIHL